MLRLVVLDHDAAGLMAATSWQGLHSGTHTCRAPAPTSCLPSPCYYEFLQENQSGDFHSFPGRAAQSLYYIPGKTSSPGQLNLIWMDLGSAILSSAQEYHLTLPVIDSDSVWGTLCRSWDSTRIGHTFDKHLQL